MSEIHESNPNTPNENIRSINPNNHVPNSAQNHKLEKNETDANESSLDEDAPLVIRTPSSKDSHSTPFNCSNDEPSPSSSPFSHLLPLQYLQGSAMVTPLGIPVNGGSVRRMWEGDLCDWLEDPNAAALTICCPCITFGKNMSMAGFGDCSCQGFVYFLFTFGLFSACQILAYSFSSLHFLHFFAFFSFFFGAAYAAYYRVETRKRFNIYGNEVCDYLYHLGCTCCALCQEHRTLQVNNVHNGIWAGRGNVVVTVGQPISITVIPPPPFVMTPTSSHLSRAYSANYSQSFSSNPGHSFSSLDSLDGSDQNLSEIPMAQL